MKINLAGKQRKVFTFPVPSLLDKKAEKVAYKYKGRY
jgi:hypothetical protein